MWSCALWSSDLLLQVLNARKWWVIRLILYTAVNPLYFLLIKILFLCLPHKHPHLSLSPKPCLPRPTPSSLSVCQTLGKEAVVHPVEAEPGRFLPRTEQSLAPSPTAPQPASRSGRAQISLSISVGPAPALSSAVMRSGGLTPRPPTLEDGMRGREGWRERSAGREKWSATKEGARGRLSQQKERKATQMLAIVLGEAEEEQTDWWHVWTFYTCRDGARPKFRNICLFDWNSRSKLLTFRQVFNVLLKKRFWYSFWIWIFAHFAYLIKSYIVSDIFTSVLSGFSLFCLIAFCFSINWVLSFRTWWLPRELIKLSVASAVLHLLWKLQMHGFFCYCPLCICCVTFCCQKYWWQLL